MKYNHIPNNTLKSFRDGMVIPALPLALKKDKTIDIRRQRALMRYYLAAGAGGVAVGVHTTQFEIRNPEFGMFRQVLKIAQEAFDEHDEQAAIPAFRVGGIVGQTQQAISEAKLLRSLGYHCALLSLAALKGNSEAAILSHCKEVASHIPIIGFYLQKAVGGIVLSKSFWKEFAEIESVIGIKIAPFDRYKTLDVVHGVVYSSRNESISLYTGNDDNILMDLLSTYRIQTPEGVVKKKIVGGLLGHWAVWTRKAVLLLDSVKRGKIADIEQAIVLANEITDSNAAFFDAANGFQGCIVGLHEVLRAQGLLERVNTLNPQERLSKGQQAEIDRVHAQYPHLNDDAFVKEHLSEWLRD